MKSFDVVAVGVLVVLLGLVAARQAASVATGGPWWLLPPALLVGVLAADLVSGLVHWLCDSFFAESTPLVGRLFIRPFREHHRDPLAITRHGFFELCGNSALTVVTPLLLVWWRVHPGEGAAPFAVSALVLFFTLAVFLTNLFHQWAHAPTVALPIRWLQRCRVILSPEHHAHHHRGDFARAYCVTTGWLNPPLDAWHLLPRCAHALRRPRGPLVPQAPSPAG